MKWLISVIILLLAIPLVLAVEIGPNVKFEPNSEIATGQYNISYTYYVDEIYLNDSHYTNTNLDSANQSCWDTDTGENLCIKAADCQLPDINTDRNITFSTVLSSPSCQIVFGPLGTIGITFRTTDPNNTEFGIAPENQTNIYGIFNMTNNGTAEASSVCLNVSISPPSGYNISADDDNTVAGSTNLTQTCLTIYSGTVNVNSHTQIWIWLHLNAPTSIWRPNIECTMF